MLLLDGLWLALSAGLRGKLYLYLSVAQAVQEVTGPEACSSDHGALLVREKKGGARRLHAVQHRKPRILAKNLSARLAGHTTWGGIAEAPAA